MSKSIIMGVLLFWVGVCHAQTQVLDGDKDNGGDIAKMERNRALSREILKGLLEARSESLKKIIEGFVMYIDPSEIEDAEVKLNYQIMRMSTKAPLLNEVRYINYVTSEAEFQKHCPASSQACTTNLIPGSPIYFSIDSLVRENASLATLAGIIMHEHSRHYLGSSDHTHQLANYFRDAFLANKHRGKTFEAEDLIAGGYTLGADPETGRKENVADLFCRSKGFERASSFKGYETVKDRFQPSTYYLTVNYYFTVNGADKDFSPYIGNGYGIYFFEEVTCRGWKPLKRHENSTAPKNTGSFQPARPYGD